MHQILKWFKQLDSQNLSEIQSSLCVLSKQINKAFWDLYIWLLLEVLTVSPPFQLKKISRILARERRKEVMDDRNNSRNTHPLSSALVSPSVICLVSELQPQPTNSLILIPSRHHIWVWAIKIGIHLAMKTPQLAFSSFTLLFLKDLI